MFEQLRDLRDRHGYEVCAVVSGTSGELVAKLNGAGITVQAADFGFAGLHDLWVLPWKITRLARFFRREGIDVVQTHLFHSMVIGRFAAWLALVPVRLTMVAGPFHLEAYTPRWIDRCTYWMDTKLIASCEYTRTLYREMGVSERRLALVYYGPDAARFDPSRTEPARIREEYGWAPDTPVIGMVAYFYPSFVPNRWTPPALWGRSTKGHEYLIRAMPTVLGEFPTVKCLLVGSGWEQQGAKHMTEMRELVHALGLEESVVFAGFRADANSILRALDVSVQPSLSENLGGTIESLLMECPTVATRVGGMPDSVRDGETGVLVASADPDDLARGILELLRDPGRARALARTGRKLMLERFTLRTTVDDLDGLYREGMARTGNRRQGFRDVRSLVRCLVAAPVAAYLVLRLVLVDVLWLPRWDAGWRPWHLASVRRVASRIYRASRRLLPNTKVVLLWDRFFAKIRGRV